MVGDAKCEKKMRQVHGESTGEPHVWKGRECGDGGEVDRTTDTLFV